MFVHKHPYPPFIQNDTKKLIVGTLPPPRFSTGDLLEKDVDFCYGSYYNSLWLYLDKIHGLGLRYDNSLEAVEERKRFLIQHKIGVCDIVESAVREKMDASDLGMTNITLRNVIGYLKQYPNIDTLLFTGGNSKNGPEYFFRQHIKAYNIKLKVVSAEVPRIHEFLLPVKSSVSYQARHIECATSSPVEMRDEGCETYRSIKTISLTSASGSANRAIGSMPSYQQLKNKNPGFATFDFRVMQYGAFF